MKNFKELKYNKNSKFEIVFENLDEIKDGDNVVLRLKEGDLSPLVYLYNKFFVSYKEACRDRKLFIPYLPRDYDLLNAINSLLNLQYALIYTIDNYEVLKPIRNILPKWNIPEDHAMSSIYTVLFLNMDNFDKYAKYYDTYFTYPHLKSEKGCLDRDYFSIANYDKVSIVATEIHAEDKTCQHHIRNINNIAKELKEKYKIERVELFVSHWFLYSVCFDNNNIDILDSWNIDNIDKITTTNSTGILQVEKSKRLEVVDCVEFLDV
jgi:hypothetical protein